MSEHDLKAFAVFKYIALERLSYLDVCKIAAAPFTLHSLD